MSHPWQQHAFPLKVVVVVFQMWKWKESLDREELLCGAAGLDIYQVKSVLVTEERGCFVCLSMLIQSNCVCSHRLQMSSSVFCAGNIIRKLTKDRYMLKGVPSNRSARIQTR